MIYFEDVPRATLVKCYGKKQTKKTGRRCPTGYYLHGSPPFVTAYGPVLCYAHGFDTDGLVDGTKRQATRDEAWCFYEEHYPAAHAELVRRGWVSE